MICHQIEALKEAGCDEVVLAINYRPQVMMEFLKGWEEKLGIKITCSQEEEPMGTAGPLALAKEILNKDGKGAPFFVLNSDVICEYPLKEMMDQVCCCVMCELRNVCEVALVVEGTLVWGAHSGCTKKYDSTSSQRRRRRFW